VFVQPLPCLDTLVRNLERDPVRSKRLIRQLAAEDKADFLRSALPILASETESRGARHLISVIVESGLLLPVLSSSLFTREQALAVAQAALAVDSAIDVHLARALADYVPADTESHARLMEILSIISDGVRIFPSLIRLLRHSNPRIRSKAVLMIGRGNRSPRWVRQRLADTDPRIRANAAEALWGLDNQEARDLLASLVHDSSNRVAGNAILGLYRLGDCSMVPEILALARHDSPVFRATAAWLIGEIADPRFTDAVAALLRESNAVVRRRAFAALNKIRAAVAEAINGPRRRLSARLVEPDPARRRIRLGIDTGPTLVPTQIFVSEDGVPVDRYRVVERALPETVSVVFVVPRSDPISLSSISRWKRAGDIWRKLYYVRESRALEFQLVREGEPIPPPEDCFDVWRSLAAAVNPETGGLAGKRHVILFSNPLDRPAPGEGLRSTVIAAKALVQVISSGPDPLVGRFLPGGRWRLPPEFRRRPC
jgi:hypothetical protein